MSTCKTLGLGVALLVCAAPAVAQTSAGSIFQELQNQQQHQQALPEPAPARPASTPPVEPARPGALTFVVKAFRFIGSDKVPQAQLQAAVAGYLNHPITFDDLQQAADQISQLFESRGWLVHVLLPQQDITEGVVTIDIEPAKLGDIRFQGHASRVGDAVIRAWIHAHVAAGSAINLDRLDRAVLLLNDRPDVQVQDSLQRGSAAGATDLWIQAQDKPLVSGSVSVDAYGDKSTGSTRESALLSLNGPGGGGGLFTLNVLHSTGNDNDVLSATVPIGMDGLRVGANLSRMNYQVVNQSFQALALSGDTNSGGMSLQYPIVRSRPSNLLLTASWNFNQFQNYNTSGPVADQTYDTNVVQLGLSGNQLDSGLNDGSMTLSLGNIGRPREGQYNSSYQVAGQFAKLRFLASRTQGLTPLTSAYLALSGQWASRNVDSSEQLYLGGPFGVRAYASGQAPATQGEQLTAELRRTLADNARAALFYDLGYAQTWKFNSSANTYSNHYWLQGTGLTLSWTGPRGLALSGTWAHRLGQPDASVVSYLQANGGLDVNRFWLNASLPF